MTLPPRYRNFKPDKAAFHAARLLYYYELTGEILSGTLQQQHAKFNKATRYYRKSNNRTPNSQPVLCSDWTEQHDAVLISLREVMQCWDRIARVMCRPRWALETRFNQLANEEPSSPNSMKARRVDAAYALCQVSALTL